MMSYDCTLWAGMLGPIIDMELPVLDTVILVPATMVSMPLEPLSCPTAGCVDWAKVAVAVTTELFDIPKLTLLLLENMTVPDVCAVCDPAAMMSYDCTLWAGTLGPMMEMELPVFETVMLVPATIVRVPLDPFKEPTAGCVD